jgi:ribulose-5-phosphate 4-epimerase/fuculose-1-phosphate aldolase
MWNDDGGRPSSIVDRFASAFGKNGFKVDLYNGGYYDDLTNLIELVIYYDYVVWWADVPNDKPKIRNVKEINSRCILITSKRNDNNKYSYSELINRALETKANLFVVFSKEDPIYSMRIMDPLGNSWFYGFEIDKCSSVLASRMEYLLSITRQGCKKADGNIDIPDEAEFFELVRHYGDIFHDLIQPDKGVTRFLGNSSFRCQRGFPSFKKDGQVFVSRRNVDKRYIDKDSFVPVKLENNVLYHYGDIKPSVDTPIQIRLYNLYPNINYMIHAHVYIDGAPFTQNNVPCGGLEEIAEIMDVAGIDFNKDFYAINLIGHGCIVMAKSVEQLKNLPYIARQIPEILL